MAYKLNGELFDIGVEHRIGDTNYPRTWFLDQDNRAAMGIVDEPDPAPPQPQLAEAQARLILQAKADAAALLQPTDWKGARASEPNGQPWDQATLDYRAAVRAAENAYEAAVLAAASVPDLADLPPVAWPP